VSALLTSAPPIEPSLEPFDPQGDDGDFRIRAVTSAIVLAIVALAAVILLPPVGAGGVLLGVSLAYLARRQVFNWTSMLLLLAAVIMFIPVRRYAIPIPLPFALEPYRLLIVALVLAIIVALVIDPRFRWRPVVFGWPFAVFLALQAVAIVVNGPFLVEQGFDYGALTSISQFLVLISVLFIARQLLTSEAIVNVLLVFLVWAGVIVALFAVLERFARVNVFLLLGNVLPLTLLREEGESLRAGGARAYASSQHPIALAVLFCLLIPLAIYLAKYAGWPRNEISRKVLYALAIGAMIAGLLVAVSRTGVVVLGVMFLMTLLLRPRLALLLGIVAFPFGLLAAVVVPALFEKTVLSLFDVQSLIASQYASPGFRGQGRLADLAPALAEVAQNPFFGTGPGSRVVIGENANAQILDNQWLGTLLESGAVGVLGLIVFLATPPLMLLVFAFRDARRRHSALGISAPQTQRHAMLAFTLAVSMVGYITSMFFYDAFAFMQTFFVLCLLLAIGGWLLTEGSTPMRNERPERALGRRRWIRSKASSIRRSLT
jgi:hypothetical protein